MERTIQPIRYEPDIDTLGYIQCVTCGKTMGHLYEKANELRRRNLSEIEIYETLGLKRTCCRYHLFSGIKMPMVKYLDETVRLDLDIDETIETSKEDKENSDKFLSIKSRLTKLKETKNEPSDNSKRISFFVAT